MSDTVSRTRAEADPARALARDLTDPEFRRAYMEGFLNRTLASQIQALREQRHWSQRQLAKRLQTTQSAISRMEDPHYGHWSVRKLKELAAAFDLSLAIRFESFGEMIGRVQEFPVQPLQRPGFDQDNAIRTLLDRPATAPGRTGPDPAVAHKTPPRSGRLPPWGKERDLQGWLLRSLRSAGAAEAIRAQLAQDEPTTCKRPLAAAVAALLQPEPFQQLLADSQGAGAMALLDLAESLSEFRWTLVEPLDVLRGLATRPDFPASVRAALRRAMAANQVDERWLAEWDTISDQGEAGQREAVGALRQLVASVAIPSTQVISVLAAAWGRLLAPTAKRGPEQWLALCEELTLLLAILAPEVDPPRWAGEPSSEERDAARRMFEDLLFSRLE